MITTSYSLRHQLLSASTDLQGYVKLVQYLNYRDMFRFLIVGIEKTSMLHVNINRNKLTGLRQVNEDEPMNMMRKMVVFKQKLTIM